MYGIDSWDVSKIEKDLEQISEFRHIQTSEEPLYKSIDFKIISTSTNEKILEKIFTCLVNKYKKKCNKNSIFYIEIKFFIFFDKENAEANNFDYTQCFKSFSYQL